MSGEIISNLGEHRQRFLEARSREPSLKGGGGGGTFDSMEARVKFLETAFEKIDAKLDKLVSEVQSGRLDVSEVKGRVTALPDARSFGELQGKINGMPTGEQFGRLSERVEKLPTFKKIAALVAFVGVLIALALNAQKLLEAALPAKPPAQAAPAEQQAPQPNKPPQQ